VVRCPHRRAGRGDVRGHGRTVGHRRRH
jgi:hypothetical protein